LGLGEGPGRRLLLLLGRRIGGRRLLVVLGGGGLRDRRRRRDRLAGRGVRRRRLGQAAPARLAHRARVRAVLRRALAPGVSAEQRQGQEASRWSRRTAPRWPASPRAAPPPPASPPRRSRPPAGPGAS